MRTIALLAVSPAVLCSSIKRAEPAPLITRDEDIGGLIANKYIVKFKEDSSVSVFESAISILPETPDHVFENTIRGFSATLDATSLESLRDHPNVDYIEQDATVELNAYVSQLNAEWGLGRISYRRRGSTTYTYDDSAGTGTCSYVLDTGIDTNHPDFEGRASWAGNFVDSSNTDVYGHGTHVAGTIGSTTYGVAKNTQLYAVKVLNDTGSGTVAGLIAGVDSIPSHAAGQSCPNGVLANMSLGAPFSRAINDAATRLVVDNNIFLAVAAGNRAANASSYSPASAPSVCTVGASDRSDRKAVYSNYGKVVDIYAPGTDVISTWPGGGSHMLSGTSMASPHIAGLGAYLATLEGNPGPLALCSRIFSIATVNGIVGVPIGSGHGRLAYNGSPYGN